MLKPSTKILIKSLKKGNPKLPSRAIWKGNGKGGESRVRVTKPYELGYKTRRIERARYLKQSRKIHGSKSFSQKISSGEYR